MNGLSKRPHRILVVEDDDAIRNLVDRALREVGYETCVAPNGLEALGLLETEASCDLLLTDLLMPEMSGDELVRRARALRPELKVLYLTAYSNRLFSERPVLWENETFIDKPITINGLREAVSLALFGHMRGPRRKGTRQQMRR
jgi:CheY-like chemotaxis protein